MLRVAAGLVVGFLFSAGAATAQSNDAGLYLYLIPTTQSHRIQTLHNESILVDLVVPDPDYLAVHLGMVSGLTVINKTGTYVRVSAGKVDTIKGGPVPAHLAESFVIDYREPAVASHVRRLSEAIGRQPSIEDLIAYVDAAIPSKSYRKGFDLASQVAASGEGDCTEHAVLLAALARALGMPARVVFGVMLFEQDDHLQSFGHAWTEIHDGRTWRIADATRPVFYQAGSTVRYLPMRSLDDEGPGYAMQLMEQALIQPSRVEQVGHAMRTQ